MNQQIFKNVFYQSLQTPK